MFGIRDTVLESARQKIGEPYIWGGSGKGYDCSGFVLDCLWSAGIDIPDMTAQGLANHFHKNHKLIGLAEPGDLMFYGDTADKIDHVMMVFNIWGRSGSEWPDMVLVGARGGDSTTVDYKAAYKRWALVDIVRGDYWKDRFQFILGIEE